MVLAPLQIEAAPLIAAVGRAFTLITALPDTEPLQLLSVMAVNTYVLFELGETLTEYGLATMPVITVDGPPLS